MSWLFDKETQQLISREEYEAKQARGVKRSSLPSPQVMRDIKPFKNVAVDGAMIGSRSEKREMMKRHDLVEVGNEKAKPRIKPKSTVKQSLKQTLQQLGS